MELEGTIALKPQDGGELLLCRGEAEGADAHVVDGERTCRGEIFCTVARQTNEGIVAQETSGLRRGHISLSEMHTIGTREECDIYSVIDE